MHAPPEVLQPAKNLLQSNSVLKIPSGHSRFLHPPFQLHLVVTSVVIAASHVY